MRKLTTTFCLTLALLLGSVGASESAPNERSVKAEDAIKCAALYLIASALTVNRAYPVITHTHNI